MRLQATGLVALLLSGVAGQAIAQAAADENAVTEVVVTGSRIKGVAPVGSNLIQVNKEALEKVPATNTVDLLRRVPQITALGVTESLKSQAGPFASGTNASRVDGINLRGVGQGATLVLFDGVRVPSSGISGTQIDMTSVPTQALQRVEVLADGSSAIYGSDAVAGVVNFIPRTRGEPRTRIRYGKADGYETWMGSQVFGWDWGSGGGVAVFQHSQNTNLNGTERDYYKSDLRSKGGLDYRSNQCNPGTIIVGGVSYAIPAGGVTPATANQLVPNTVNLCELYRTGDILAEQSRQSLYFNFDQRVHERVKLYVRGFGAFRHYLAQDFGQGSTTQVVRLSVPATNAFFVRPPGTTGAVSVDYFYGPDQREFTFRGKNSVYNIHIGADIDLPWEWSAGWRSTWSRTDEELYGVNFLAAEQTRVLASNDPRQALNPFGPNPNGNPQTVFSNLFNPYARNVLRTDSIDLNGPLFKLPGGMTRLAVGFDYNDNSVVAGNYRGAINNPVNQLTPSSRKVKALYGELFVPLFGDDNAIPGFRRLDLSLAGRIDDYSDAGRVENPKLGANWSPFDGLLLKGNYGTSFKAPSTASLVTDRPGAALIIYTATDPLSRTGTSSGVNINAGNPDLQPEESETWSFTAEFTPPQVPGLQVSLTYFDLKTSGTIASVAAANALTNPLNAPFVVRNPTQAQINDLVARFPTLLVQSGSLTPLPAFIVDTRPFNTGGWRLKGIDFSAFYQTELDFGQVRVGVNGTRNLDWKVKQTKAAAADDLLNLINNPLKLRFRAEAGWSQGPWSVDVFANYANGYTNNLVTPFQKVKSLTTFDGRIGYSFEEGNKYTDGLTLSLEASNIFDKDPPFVNIQSGIDGTVASPIGRLVSFTIDKQW